MNRGPAEIQSCTGTRSRVWLPGGDSCSAWVSVAFSVASVLKLAPGWIPVRSQLPQAGPWGHVSGAVDSSQACHAGVSRKGEMPNVLNCSSYKKVGLFLFLRNAPCRQHVGSRGTKQSKRAFTLCSVLGALFARLFHHRVWFSAVGWTCSTERSYAEQYVLF